MWVKSLWIISVYLEVKDRVMIIFIYSASLNTWGKNRGKLVHCTSYITSKKPMRQLVGSFVWYIYGVWYFLKNKWVKKNMLKLALSWRRDKQTFCLILFVLRMVWRREMLYHQCIFSMCH